MKLNNLLLAAGCGLFFLAACQSPKDQIIRKWQVSSINSPASDSLFQLQLSMYDTMTTVDSSMILFFQTSNLDSIKIIAKSKLEDAKKQQDEMVKEISMDFRKDGYMVQEGQGRKDSAKYEIKDKLVLLTMPGQEGMIDTFHIENISGSDLKLKAGPTGNEVYINLKPAK